MGISHFLSIHHLHVSGFIVISTKEEYSIFGMNDLKAIKQKSLKNKDVHFDEMAVENRKKGGPTDISSPCRRCKYLTRSISPESQRSCFRFELSFVR